MGGYYTSSCRVVLFCVLIGFDFVSVHKNAQKNRNSANIKPC